MRRIENEELTLRWGELSPLVERALEHGLGESTAYDLYLLCLTGEGQFWEHERIIGITRFNYFQTFKQLQIVTVTGSWLEDGGIECLPVLEQFARDTGCRNVSVWGRHGWRRKLKDYKEPYAVLVKEV